MGSPEQVVLATITIPPQDFMSSDRQSFGEALSFSPWHSRSAHEPIGSINRARRDAYRDSSVVRHEASGTSRREPSEEQFNALTLHRFFEALRVGDVQGVQLCLHPDIEFSDIGFDLRGAEVGAMWHMILSKGLKVSYRDVRVTGNNGTAQWECDYDFRTDPSATPRPVHNAIGSTFRFESGLIRVHEDACDFWTWFEQAMGPLGKGAHTIDSLDGKLEVLIGRGTSLDVESQMRAKVRAAARDKIDAFIQQHPQYRVD